ncbi:MAG: hypothetical protein KKH28_14455 [Elusimicrobia bacterium]|nr:hypothetical protein [Elusimicrobiota bacterium]
MKTSLTVLTAIFLGVLSDCAVCSAGAINQLHSETWTSGASDNNEAAKFANNEISVARYEPFKEVLEEIGFAKVNILIAAEEAAHQEKAIKNGVPFEAALRKAFENLLAEAKTADSKKVLKARINRAATVLFLFDLSENADRGESAKTNWIFYLYNPQLSKNGSFIIVDKNNKEPAYNYPASVSRYNSGVPGGTNEAAEIRAVTGSSGVDIGGVFAGERKDGQINASADVLGDIRRQGRILYDNYGAPLTMVGYDGWPGQIPVYGEFAGPYRKYLQNAGKIDKFRIDIRGLWIALSENISEEKAREVLADMKKMGREYDRMVGECIRYVREGQRLYADGKATFPSLLHNVKLVKGSTYIDLYDDNGKKITKKVCKRWGSKWSWLLLSYVTACVEYAEVPVRAKVPDYYLAYGYGGDQIYPQRARMIDVPPTPAFPEVFVNKSVQRDQYDMEVIVTCTLDKDPGKGWFMTSAKLRKGKAGSSDSLGGGVSVGGKVGVPLVAEGSVNVNINYSHSWSHFRFGEMVAFPEFVGKQCFELGRDK